LKAPKPAPCPLQAGSRVSRPEREGAHVRRFFAEPSDGLEPSTPSLPWRLGGSPRGPEVSRFPPRSPWIYATLLPVRRVPRGPRVDLRIPVFVPKTCPQAVGSLGDGSSCPALAESVNIGMLMQHHPSRVVLRARIRDRPRSLWRMSVWTPPGRSSRLVNVCANVTSEEGIALV